MAEGCVVFSRGLRMLKIKIYSSPFLVTRQQCCVHCTRYMFTENSRYAFVDEAKAFRRVIQPVPLVASDARLHPAAIHQHNVSNVKRIVQFVM